MIQGDEIRFMSSQPIEGTWLHYDFSGKVDGDTMQGTVGLEEYGEARWTARRHHYTEPGGESFIRPVKGA